MDTLEDLAKELSRFQLWGSLFEKFECSHRSVDQSQFFFKCRSCKQTAFTIVCQTDKSGCSWNCSCPIATKRNSWVDLVLHVSDQKLTAKEILGGAVELVNEHKQAMVDKQILSPERRKQLGIYYFNESAARKVPSKKNTPAVRPIQTKPKRPAKAK